MRIGDIVKVNESLQFKDKYGEVIHAGLNSCTIRFKDGKLGEYTYNKNTFVFKKDKEREKFVNELFADFRL